MTTPYIEANTRGLGYVLVTPEGEQIVTHNLATLLRIAVLVFEVAPASGWTWLPADGETHHSLWTPLQRIAAYYPGDDDPDWTEQD